jgi:hypothetical protein
MKRRRINMAWLVLSTLVGTGTSTWSQPTDSTPRSDPAGSATIQGVVIQIDERRPSQFVPWYEVPGGVLPDGVDQKFASIADRAWRAHTRVQRGDFIGALPLYVALRNELLWQTGPQSLDVCEGLTRCLISNSDRVAAIEPMLATFIACSSDGQHSAELPGVFDTSLLIRRDLPPVFASSDLGSSLESVHSSGDARIRMLHAYFELASCSVNDQDAVLNRLEELKRRNRTRDAGLVLVEQMCFAQAHPDESKRRGARESLVRRTQTQRGTWIEVWARLALGAGQIRDRDPYIRDRGVIELVHIIVRLGEVDPGLTMLAAQIAQEYLRDTDRAPWGAQLMQDAQRNLNPHGQSAGVKETRDNG